MRFEGVYAAMVTPFEDKGPTLSIPRLQAYCEFLIACGVHGLYPFGTTGEWPLLSEEERMRGAEAVVAFVRKRAAVVIHTGAQSTDEAVRLSVHACDIGADAVGIICPGYYPLDEEALLDHFRAVAREVRDFPVFIYNIPSLTGNDVTPGLLLRIAGQADNVIGLKFSSDDLPRFREYRRLMGEGFTLFIGSDSVALAALQEGGDGVVSGNASVLPDSLLRLYQFFRAGSFSEALEAQKDLDEFIQGVEAGKELSIFKEILRMRGVEVGEVRRPLKPLKEAGRAAVRERVQGLKLMRHLSGRWAQGSGQGGPRS